MIENTSIPLNLHNVSNYQWQYVDSTRLSYEHIRCACNTWFDNRSTENDRSDLVVEISLMDAEVQRFHDSVRLYANFKPHDKANGGFMRTKRLKHDFRTFYDAQEVWFKQILAEHRVDVKQRNGTMRKKNPVFYTCGIRPAKIRKTLNKGCGLVIMDTDGITPKVFAIAIGNVRYTFEAMDSLGNGACNAQQGRKVVDVSECIDYNDDVEDWDFDSEIEDLLLDE
ncbi:hypothetical protein VPHD479_0340 [Vibrio phage D479]